MSKEKTPIERADASPDGKNDILEQYLAETIDLRNAPAIIIDKNGTSPVFRTLDGTQVFPLWELAELTGRTVKELGELLDTGQIEGIEVGEWFARKDEVADYLKED